MNDATLKEFLECCGPLVSLTNTPTGLAPEHGRQYTAVYADAAAAQSALVLNNMTLVVGPRTSPIHVVFPTAFPTLTPWVKRVISQILTQSISFQRVFNPRPSGNDIL